MGNLRSCFFDGGAVLRRVHRVGGFPSAGRAAVASAVGLGHSACHIQTAAWPPAKADEGSCSARWPPPPAPRPVGAAPLPLWLLRRLPLPAPLAPLRLPVPARVCVVVTLLARASLPLPPPLVRTSVCGSRLPQLPPLQSTPTPPLSELTAAAAPQQSP